MDCFHILAIVNNAMINMEAQVSVQDTNLKSFQYVSRGRIVGSYGSSIFNFLNNLKTGFNSGNNVACFFATNSGGRLPSIPHNPQTLHLLSVSHWTHY